jgi:hypothetical protein
MTTGHCAQKTHCTAAGALDGGVCSRRAPAVLPRPAHDERANQVPTHTRDVTGRYARRLLRLQPRPWTHSEIRRAREGATSASPHHSSGTRHMRMMRRPCTSCSILLTKPCTHAACSAAPTATNTRGVRATQPERITAVKPTKTQTHVTTRHMHTLHHLHLQSKGRRQIPNKAACRHKLFSTHDGSE